MPLSRPLSESVVVITGGSGGIGAMTAMLLASRGTSVALNARDPDGLDRVAAVCRRHGGRATWYAGDITDPATAPALAERAVTDLGRIDAWVNCAAVALYCSLLDVPGDEVRRVLDVNVLGTLFGVQEAARHLRGDGGVIVNVASALARMTVPWMGPYNASKHAVAGLTETLREELLAAGERRISVGTVLPASIHTPLYDNAANRTGHPARALPPAYRPGKPARVIVGMLRRPRRQAYAGGTGRLVAASYAVAPGITERVLSWYGTHAGLDLTRAETPTTGNLYEPIRPKSHSR
jgi:NAD(P)-dependent dehydrogenase (short-subunit alcohol dehydrogenase family)